MSEHERKQRDVLVADIVFPRGGVSETLYRIKNRGYFPVKVGRNGHFVGVYENNAGHQIAVITHNHRTTGEDPSKYLSLKDIMEKEKDLVACEKGSDKNESEN